jgi:hypothetical protein
MGRPAYGGRTTCVELAAIPELDAVARATIPGYTGSLSADAAATVDAMQGAVSWITTNVPKDANGWVSVHKWNTDGTQTARNFTPAQTAGLVTVLNAVGATIG